MQVEKTQAKDSSSSPRSRFGSKSLRIVALPALAILAHRIDAPQCLPAQHVFGLCRIGITLVMNFSSDGIAIADENGKFVRVNSALLRLIDKTEADVLSCTVFDLLGDAVSTLPDLMACNKGVEINLGGNRLLLGAWKFESANKTSVFYAISLRQPGC